MAWSSPAPRKNWLKPHRVNFRLGSEAVASAMPKSDGVDAPRRHRSARVEVFEHHCEGGVRGRRYHCWA
jgi:hypothetical protein